MEEQAGRAVETGQDGRTAQPDTNRPEGVKPIHPPDRPLLPEEGEGKDEGREMAGLKMLLEDVVWFSRGVWPEVRLRAYQEAPARAVVEAVRAGKGGSFVWVFSRQAGKDEALAQVLAYLLTLYQLKGGQIVVAAPTLRQAQISRDRLLARLDRGLNRGKARCREGYIVSLGRASARFLSGAPSANVRGETASLLLVANETQDLDPARWDAVFDPMAASTNAPALFLGTVWTARTLLARQMRHLRELEKAPAPAGPARRVFQVNWREVAASLPAYGARVEERIRQFGPDHPFIRTEYELLELDGSGGLFNPARQALMQGSHPRQAGPRPGRTYCLLVDLAGEDEGAEGIKGNEGFAGPNRPGASRRDSTAVTVVEVAFPGGPERAGLPGYRVVQRYLWTGVKQTTLFSRLLGLAEETWRAALIVVDATGVGAGLASFLQKALPRRVLPYVFSAASKSELGWKFLGIVDSGRYKDYIPDGAAETSLFWQQLEAVEYEVRPGPGKLLRWSVPSAALHDDLVISAALCGVLEERDWRPRRAVGLAEPGEPGSLLAKF